MGETQRAIDCAKEMYDADAASRNLGIEVEVSAAGRSVARMQVVESMINGFGVCHGGYIFLLADTAFAFACNSYDNITLASSGEIDFLRRAKVGDTLLAIAAERHRGSRHGLYDVLVSNQDDETVAVFRGRSHSTGKPVLGQSDT